jgi:hypothetical protein
MLDRDLAELYAVETRNLNKAVSRNRARFPDDDFMFTLSKQEFDAMKGLMFQSGTSNGGAPRGGTRKPPRVFTEQGVAMLSSVLHSHRAVQVNIQIIKTFVRMREMLSSHDDLRRKLESMEQRYDKQFRSVFDAIKQMLAQEEAPRRRIGFADE